uniref:Uncharacterized protein n=1 Tax=Opuntia streptacantha TaxID=393608 RepID=A0A7C9AXL6_OPUST
MFLCCLRVLLQVDQYLSHYRVSENVLNFRVLHCLRLSLFEFLRTQISTAGLIDLLHTSSHTIQQFLVVGIMFQPLLIGLQCFVIFFHEKLDGTLPSIPLHKGRIKLNTLLSIPQTFWQGSQFCVTCSSVAVSLWILRVPLYSFCIMFHSFRVLLLFKVLVAFLTLLISYLRIKILLLL